MCLLFELNCCNTYFSEWKLKQRTPLILLLLSMKAVLILIFIGILLFHPNLDIPIVEGNRATYTTMFAAFIWICLCLSLFDIYTPFQAKIFPLWWKISVMVIFTLLVIFFVVAFMWLDIFPSIPADTQAFDLWTIVHTMWGVWLSFLVPFIWCCLLSTTWEILEMYTKGLGETEGTGNHLVDIFSVIIGYLIVILIFTPRDIPWITAKRNIDQCCCFTVCCKKEREERVNRNNDDGELLEIEKVNQESDDQQSLMSEKEDE